MLKKRKVPFPSFRGFVAAPASAWGQDFLAIIGGVEDTAQFETAGECAIVDVCGPLVQHDNFFMPSYESVKAKFLAALASDASTIVLRIDSPGGDFAGCLELSRYLRAAAADAGKRLVGFTDSQALSAAYAIACACDELVITPSATVGSIGVWAALCDQTAQDRAMGINIAVVSSGEQKAERNPHVPITESSIQNLQVEVNAMAGMFFDVVSEMRGIPLPQVEALQGGTKFGAMAIEARLADRTVNSWGEFIATAHTAGARTMGLKEEKAAYRSKLAKLAASDGDEGKEAAAELTDFDKKEDSKAKKAAASEEKDGDKEAKASDEGEEEKKDAKAEGDDKKEEAKASDEDMGKDKKDASASASASAVELARRLHALESSIAAKALSDERNALLATRPDFNAEVRSTLATAPLATVRKAVETWPRIVSPDEAAVNAQVPGGTRGAGQENGNQASADAPRIPESGELQSEYVARHMAGHKASSPTHFETGGKSLVLGIMTPGEAAKRLAEINAKEGV